MYDAHHFVCLGQTWLSGEEDEFVFTSCLAMSSKTNISTECSHMRMIVYGNRSWDVCFHYVGVPQNMWDTQHLNEASGNVYLATLYAGLYKISIKLVSHIPKMYLASTRSTPTPAPIRMMKDPLCQRGCKNTHRES